ncbi:histidinol dehydrogenase [Rhizobium sp. TH2]|uniref:histidinol dehydrogenase n=1 Tax=Rhizobium sp. TH2 TaxID=2775403 RepID=UPI002156FF5F|nr:histidinol dehydrogenase [Rhizobium sp. TH2]UVC09814.1 histidinol dehydrogenase [Rhizobium sp. TH2]
MAIWLNFEAPDFERDFSGFLTTKREASEDVNIAVKAIISDVVARGDAALKDYSLRFDALDFNHVPMRVTVDDLDVAERAIEPAVRDALHLAAERIERHHRRQLPKDDIYQDALGVTLGSRWTAIEAVGLYVPGGMASYPSSVLMNAIPARVAGVPRIVMVVPARKGAINPAVLAAAKIAGINEIYRIGGAQAVAALAFGTETISPVAKITGPGNAYVAAAKRQVFGTVGIDMIAGPSEVLIIADRDNDPDWLAADLLAQAEHDTGAQSILITDDEPFAKSVETAVERQLKRLSRAETAAASWRDFGAIILVPDLEKSVPLADRIAAEHVEIATSDPDALMLKIRNAGAFFLGRHTPEVIGDYVGGSNHVLPTARSARFSSGLSVLDYMKRSSILRLDAAQLKTLAPAAITLAECEGLDAHARSVAIRLNPEA